MIRCSRVLDMFNLTWIQNVKASEYILIAVLDIFYLTNLYRYF